MSHELIPPDESHSNHRATVTIETLSVFVPDADLQKNKAEEKKQEQSSQDLFIDDPFAPPSQRLDAQAPTEYPDLSGVVPKPAPTIESPAEARSISTKETYNLIFRDKEWQIVGQPESDQERLWFEYALQSNR